MIKLLVPVDGSPAALRAVRFAADFVPAPCEVELHLLNVQEPVLTWEVRRFLREGEIEKVQREKAWEIVEDAAKEVRQAGLTDHVHVEFGDVAKTVDAVAKHLGCRQIIMGTRGVGAIEELLMGSVSTKVLHRTSIPVTLVK